MDFWAYILRCADGSYYTGHTDHLDNRIADHQHGHFRGYTLSRRPVHLVWSQDFSTRHEALQAERRIKGWSRAKKEALIDGRWDEVSRLSRGESGFVLRQAQDERELGQTEVVVAPAALETMLREADQAHLHECCGVLLGREGRIEGALPARNVHPHPERHFEIDPQALFDAYRAARSGGPQVLGYYHSHPVGEAKPSVTDQERALRDGSIWAIIADQEVRLWRDTESGFTELSYRVITA